MRLVVDGPEGDVFILTTTHLVNIYYAYIHDWNITLLKKNLSKDDFKKLESFQHLPTLNLKILNRSLLRYLFTYKYGIKNDQIEFVYNNREKPFLKNYSSIYFNSSHSEEVVLIGMTDKCRLGVDIEFIRARKDENAIARLFLSSEEYSSYQRHRSECPHAFYKFWTAKESVIKALGKGLWEGDLVPEITLLNNQFVLRSKAKILNDWNITFLDLEKNYSGCLVTNHADIKVEILRLTPEIISK